MDLSKSVAIVSGGASGLGRAVVQKIVEAGGQATILDLNQEQGEKTQVELGDAVNFVQADISNENQVNAAVEKTVEKFGSLNFAVSCAGILGAGRVLGREGPMQGDYFAKVIQINLVGSFLLTKAAANAMQHNTANELGERGVIVNTASVAAFEGQIGQCAYSASKSGVVGLTLPLAREFARLGIRVMTVAPGIFRTPMMEIIPPDIQASLGAQVPFPSRLGEPAEFAQLVTDIYGNAMLNGETIRLDGAIRMQPK